VRIESADWPEFSQLLDRMLDLPSKEREEWVKRLSGADEVWAPRLLELLRGAADADRAAWLDTLPPLIEDTYSKALPPDDVPAEPPISEIGPYRVIRLLGRGGMGSVWYAERSDRLVRRGVALKLPLGLNADEVLAARFAREREILAGLVHPHIARLYDVGITANGQPYLALEYIEGEPLNEYCDSRCLDLRSRIRLFLQVLDAVQYAHSRLVIHRDLKPSNILVTTTGDAQLLDFGVAKLLGSEGGEMTELTGMGNPGMTPCYASPEQIAREMVSTTSDVYSLGVVLFELLVGTRPYRMRRASRGGLEDAILGNDIPVPSAAVTELAAPARSTTLKKLRRALRGDLDAILLKMLERRPERRYPTVAAVSEDLIRYAEGNTVQAHRPSRWYWLRKFVARNRLIVASATLAVAALVVGAAVAVWQAREAQRQARLAEAERDRAQAAAEHRQALDDFMSDLLLDAGRTGGPISLTTLISRADEISEKEFAHDPEARAAVLATMGRFAWDVGGPDNALSYFDTAQRLVAGSRDAGLQAHIVCTRALIAGELGHADEAQRAFRKIIDDARSPPAAKSECWGDLAGLAISRYDGSTAIAAVAQALQQWQAAPRRSLTDRLILLRYQAEAQALNGLPGVADRGYVHVMQELKQIGRERSDLSDDLRADRVKAATYSGDFKLSLAQADEAIAMLNADFPDRPPPAVWLYHRSAALAFLGRYAQALKGFESVARLAASRDRLSQQRAELGVAEVLSKLGRSEEAERHYGTAVDIANGLPGYVPLADIAALMTRAKLDLDAGQFHFARQRLTLVLQAHSVGEASLATAHRLRALADLAEGDLGEALEDAHAATDLSVKQRGDKAFSAWVGQSKLVLGQVWQAKGDLPRAHAAYAEAVEQLTDTVDGDHPALQQARALLADTVVATN
jgi:serine/threonine protein kinase